MISLQQYRSSIGRFGSLSHREAKVSVEKNNLKRKVQTKVVLLLCCLYVIMAAACGGLQGNVSQLKTYNDPTRKYHNINQIDSYASIQYYPTSKSMNKTMHIQNGNRADKKHPMTLCYWNKGSADLENRSESIAEIVNDYKPHVLGIGEAQFKQGNDLAKVQQPGYTLHLGPCLDTLGVCRVAVYTSNSLMVERRRDLEDVREPVVCLQLGLPHQRKILLLCGYRQWKVPGTGQ